MIVLEGSASSTRGTGNPLWRGVARDSGWGHLRHSRAQRAGKSTLIRCLNLLERPSRGRILFDGRDITALEGRPCAATVRGPA